MGRADSRARTRYTSPVLDFLKQRPNQVGEERSSAAWTRLDVGKPASQRETKAKAVCNYDHTRRRPDTPRCSLKLMPWLLKSGQLGWRLS
jgi:hypothetical protein